MEFIIKYNMDIFFQIIINLTPQNPKEFHLK